MTFQPLVSVIIPCYNHSKYVVDTLDSAIKDTYENKEICIIDDGSKDDSVVIIEQWIAKNHHLVNINFKYRENKGLCATLNELIDMAQGKYIIPCASDDMLYGNTIAERVKVLEDNPTKKVLVSDAWVIDGNNNVIMSSSMEDYNSGCKSWYSTEKGIIRGTILKPCISGATLFVNKDVYRSIGKYPENLKAEDWWFYQRTAALGLILFLNIKVSYYRVHDTNTSGNNFLCSVDLFGAIIKTYKYNFKYFAFSEKMLIIRQVIKFYYLMLRVKLAKSKIGKLIKNRLNR